MSAYYIGVHFKTSDAAGVRQAVQEVFAAAGFRPLGDEALAAVVEDEDRLPDHDDWYGVVVSSIAGIGWVSLYVADWQDSGALAKGVSSRLAAQALELWVAADTHWGYTYYEDGEVRDRFTDAPETVAETPIEAQAYEGQADVIAPILRVPIGQARTMLEAARAAGGQFAGGPVDNLAEAIGLPFGHAFTSYDYFFEDDPDDYQEDLEDWPAFRHLLFASPPGRETLVE